MKVLQINVNLNTGSTGRITSEIGDLLLSKGHESIIGYGRKGNKSSSESVKIGTRKDIIFHGIITRMADCHGFGSYHATKLFINHIKKIKPDLIHLHNIHGYYLHAGLLFEYIKTEGIPIVWTFHDCWPFTGHCTLFEKFKCEKWKEGCFSCPNKRGYPKSWLIDNSKNNYQKKKELFTSLGKLVVITPSHWLANYVEKSYFKNYPIRVINNGVDLNIFKPQNPEKIRAIRNKYQIGNRRLILGVANIWDHRKGFDDFIELRSLLDDSFAFILVGLDRKQLRKTSLFFAGSQQTENIQELAMLYSLADVFVNPTHADNFPTTNLEALACGTPVITYKSGGSPEAIDKDTGIVVNCGDLSGLVDAIMAIIKNGKSSYTSVCRNRAEQLFDKNARYSDYITLYQSLIEKKNF